ncbi:hypothetical protein FACS1894187_03590 [Synergistales bacterium]|nr:hypothetical protein FACS1894187_03590 [Synergistales bacterium]
MGLMKLATYFRNRGDDVRFFKGDLRNLAADLLFEEFWKDNYNIALGKYTGLMREHIKTGKLAPLNELNTIPEFTSEKKLRNARKRYADGNYPKFDIVGITTLFTFYWKETIDTINTSKKFVAENGRILVGGIASTILPLEIEKATGIKPYLNDRVGALLDRPGQIDSDSTDIIDELPLDYSILEEIEYRYPASNAYFGYMTRGCVNNCTFCAVPRLEPKYCQRISIKEQIAETIQRFGVQKDLLLLDNNVFASSKFNNIIDEINELGFGKGETYNSANEYSIAINNISEEYNVRTYVRKVIKLYDSVVPKLSENEQGVFYNSREELGLLYADTATRESVLAFDETFAPLYERFVYSKLNTSRGRVRYIDFNQGVDARLMTEAKMKKLSEVNIRPLRIAFDHWGVDPQKPKSRPIRDIYTDAVRLAAKYGIRDLSNYLLYNSDDDVPDELYLRLQLNINLCEELGVSIYSFPMKYHPIDDPEYFDNRNFAGKAWNRKYIRAIQAVLNSTHGKIGRGKSFFEAAFGKDLDQFHQILMMPEAFIIERHKYDKEAYDAYLKDGSKRIIKAEDLKRYGNMTAEWRAKFTALTLRQRKQAEKVIHNNIFTDETCDNADSAVSDVLRYYRIKR